MKEFMVYTLARLALFMVSYALIVIVYVLVNDSRDVPLLWPLVAALVLSAIASVYLLREQRERFAAVIERRATSATQRFEQSRSKEDEEGS